MENINNGDEVTSFENICSILSELWTDYKVDKDFEDFIAYNDIGLPLAFLIDSELVIPTEMAKQYVKETWLILLGSLEIEKDLGWESLEEVFRHRNNK